MEDRKDIVERLNTTATIVYETHSSPQEPQVSLMREAVHEIEELRSLISAMKEG